MQELQVDSTVASLTQTNTADFAFDGAAKDPQHVALRRRSGGGWRDVSSKEFVDEVVALAKGVIAAGIEPGDRVAVMSKTRYEWTLVDFALFSVGAVVVPIYETSSAEQVDWICSDSGAKAIFVETDDHRQIVESVRDDIPTLELIWTFEDGAVDELTQSGTGVADDDVESRRSAVDIDDLASIIYTSGTTGRPKGCELTHHDFISEAVELQGLLSDFLNDDTSTLLFLPIAHVFGRAIEIGCFATGCTLGHTADVKNLVEDLGGFKPTFVLAVPRVFEKVYNTAKQRAHSEGKGRIFDYAEKIAIAYSEADGSPNALVRVQHAVFDRLVYSKLRAALGGRCEAAVSGGAPLGTRLGHFFRGIGVTIYEGYGLTETTAAVTVNRPEAIRIGTVGRPIGGTTARIADDGELLFRAPNVFRGYWNNAEATAEVLDADGWFHTGDIGDIDDDGFVRITGRKKELIVTAGGKNVAPAVLEDRVRGHWLVSQCLVVGDQKPFIAAIVTIDPESFPRWLEQAGKPADTPVADLVDDDDLRNEIQGAITEANKAVSKAESIRKFVILPEDWTEEGGQLTPSLKLKRNVVVKENEDEIAGLYAGPKPK
ncbi:AMP-dependent synthetase/ligase [Jatrophihabitans endophyticus]|uniref:AMP-dependent synthetase/ligase n=1 Tax=Jatrophihabitans endophyticus TaxID=1206085 RepID=UPI0019D88909|nr:AMP-dependent synthetase/ligase [Jatrophihabitans endophyticus]MBE7189771.1 long-chain fatty acid--CoA ligase [Jatrophihabitans endophyticus]